MNRKGRKSVIPTHPRSWPLARRTQTPSLAEGLRRWRGDSGLTQEELAEAAGLSARVIGDIERGVDRRPYRSTLDRLATALDLSEENRASLAAAARPQPAITVPRSRRPEMRRAILVGALISVLGAAVVLALTLSPFGQARRQGDLVSSIQRLQEQPIEVTTVISRGESLWRESQACACDVGLARAFAGPDLRTYTGILTGLHAKDERLVSTYSGFQVTGLSIIWPERATASATVVDRWKLWRDDRVREVCTARFHERYDVARLSPGWRIGATVETGRRHCRTLA